MRCSSTPSTHHRTNGSASRPPCTTESCRSWPRRRSPCPGRRSGPRRTAGATWPSVLTGAAAAVRGTIGGLRSLLVDIYPPSLRTAGLVAALTDLAGTVRTRDIDVRLDLPPDGQTGLDEEQERLVFRVAQESLAQHGPPRRGQSRGDQARRRRRHRRASRSCDDGVGFDVDAALSSPPEGHLGLRVMRDLTAQSGALLEVSSAPGAGTCWRLTVPRR